MNLFQRCDKGPHEKPKRDFLDERGRMQPTCNECRQRIQVQHDERTRLAQAQQDLEDVLNDVDALEDFDRGMY